VRVSINRVFCCDWRECQTSGPGSEFLTVKGCREPRHLHFCSWDCILKHAAERPPVEVLAFGEPT
jgi:hypothetical protein